MNELEELKNDLMALKTKLIDAVSEYGENIEEQRKYIDGLVSDAEKIELQSQVADALNKAKTITQNYKPKYF